MFIGQSTKIISINFNAIKEYIGVMKLHCDVSDGELSKVINEFKGQIYQKPPLKSSVKRRLRVKRVYEIEIIERNGRYVLFRVLTEAGTYIRKLCHDMGLVLGCGANLRELRRTKSGIFTEEKNCRTMHELSEAIYMLKKGEEKYIREILLPIEFSLCGIPKIVVSDFAVNPIANGSPLMAPGILAVQEGIKRGSQVGIMTKKGELVALGISSYNFDEILKMEKGAIVQPKRVYIRPGLYPNRKAK